MTLNLFQYLNKHVLQNLLIPVPSQIDLPFVTPLVNVLSVAGDAPLTCRCCQWKGSQSKARKHYLLVDTIAELELFCPSCNQYLGFVSAPAD